MKEIREGLAARLDTIPGIQASAYLLANPTPPAAHVVPARITYDRAMARGLDEVIMIIQVFVGLVSDIGAQKRLDPMLDPSGPTSIKAAIEGDKTLGGKVKSLRVTEMTSYQVFAFDRGPVIGAEWQVTVYD